ncbi:MAG: hypothetical protein NTX59_11005 [Elusimicrobia bacterium]|nr:hypothetical protein [Elusimicrobiota bacterium]
MKKHILLIESSDIGAHYSAQAVMEMGYVPVFLCDLSHYHGDTLDQIRRYRHFDVHTGNVEKLEGFVRTNGLADALAAVASFQDARIAAAAELALRLGVPGLDRNVSKLKDKNFSFKLVPEYIPITIGFRAGQVPQDEILDLLGIFKILVAKPTLGAGGTGVLRLETPEDVARLPGHIAGCKLPKELDSGRWIVQAFATGPLFSLEGYVIDGRINYLGFTGRRKVGTTETGASFPIDPGMNPSVRENAKRAVGILVERSGFRNGYFHVEFIECEESCHMIDPNVGRPGGGPIAELLALSYNVPPSEIYKHALQVGLFHSDTGNPYGDLSRRRETEAILYGLKSGGTIRDVILPGPVSCLHTRILGNGAKASPVGQDDWSWVGILSGTSGQAKKTAGRIRIVTDEGEFGACF